MAKGKPRGTYTRVGARNANGTMKPKEITQSDIGIDSGVYSDMGMEYCHICGKEHPKKAVSGGD